MNSLKHDVEFPLLKYILDDRVSQVKNSFEKSVTETK